MHNISLEGVGKRYGFNWILSDVTHTFTSGKIYGISGANGSGKSTLIKILSGYLSPSDGSVRYKVASNTVKPEHIFKHISLAAPYTDLIQEYSLKEMFDFHSSFKVMHSNMTFKDFESILDLPNIKSKLIGEYSSGMKQRCQLALSILSETPFLLVDEPTSFLDTKAKAWFANLLNDYSKERCVIIASNEEYDLDLCDEVLTIDGLQSHL